MLELKTAVQRDIFDIELTGALDSQSAYDFKSWMIQKNLEGYRVISLNCHGLEYISSRGIGALVDIHRVFSSKKSVLALYHVSNEVLQLLDFLKLTNEIILLKDFEAVETMYAETAAEGVPVHETVRHTAVNAGPGEHGAPAQPPSVQETGGEPQRHLDKSEEEEVMELDLDEIIDEGDSQPHEREKPETYSSASSGASHDDHRPDQTKTHTETRHMQDEYINLSDARQGAEPNEFNPIYVYCPNCRQSLRIKKAGQYLCPECRTKFRYPFG